MSYYKDLQKKYSVSFGDFCKKFCDCSRGQCTSYGTLYCCGLAMCNCCCCELVSKCGQCVCQKSFATKRDVNTSRILFGSCLTFQSLPEHSPFTNMANLSPNVVLLTGDQIYLDKQTPCYQCCCINCATLTNGLSYSYDTDIDVNIAYKDLINRPDIKTLQKTKVNDEKTRILAMMDNHEFGKYGVSMSSDQKQERKLAFVEFLTQLQSEFDEKENESLMKQINEMKSDSNRGCHYYYDVNNIRIYMLDGRWYHNSNKETIIGNDELNWLSDSIKEIEAKNDKSVHLIMCPFPMMLPDFKCCSQPDLDRWKDSKEREMIFDMIDKNGIKNRTIFVTGNEHYSFGYKYDDMYEFSSSSLNHSLMDFRKWLFKFGLCFDNTCCVLCKCKDKHFAQSTIGLQNIDGFGCLDIDKDKFDFGMANNKNSKKYYPIANKF